MGSPDTPKEQRMMNIQPSDPDAVGCQGQANMSGCVQMYRNIYKSLLHARKYYEQYQVDSKKCLEKIEEIRLEMSCAVCDEKASKYFDAKRRKIMIRKDQINNVIRSCYDKDLYEVELVRDVYLAYLNYAKQVKPS